MNRQDIERIIAACGYVAIFEEQISSKQDGTSRHFVRARTRGAKNQRRYSLGRLEVVERLSEDELVKLIGLKFEESDE